MAINKKLLHFATKANFSTQLANSNIDSRSIVFIKDTGEIWTHDKLYSCASWGTNQTNYVPLTIGGVSYNLSKDGHTHSYMPISGASYIQSTGYSTSWGVTNGTYTGAFNAIMSTGSSATWLLSGTSGGVFRSGIQSLDSSGTMRFYVGNNYMQYDGSTLTATNFSGSGAALTSLNGSNISSGTVADARIAAALTGKTYNGLTVTATTGTLTLTSGKTLAVGNSITLSAPADGRTLNIGPGGTLGTAAFTDSTAYAPQSTISATLPATAGWYRIATSSAGINRCSARFEIDWALSGYHGQVTLNAGIMYGQDPTLNMVHYTHFGVSFTKARIVYHTTYSGNYAYLEIYNSTATALVVNVQMLSSLGWSLVTPSTVGSIPTGYSNQEITFYDGIVTEGQLVSSIGTGIAPLVVSSTTKVNNLNSDLLDGYHAATAATANTIVQRDGSGYIYGVYINSSRPNETSAAASYIYDSGDGWLRKKTLANARAELVTKTQVEAVLTGNITSHTHNYLPLTGGTLSGNLFIPGNVSIIQNQASTSNYTAAIKWYKGGVSQNTYDPQIGQYNTGGTGSGAITILPYSTSTEPWNGTVGLYLTGAVIKFNNNNVYHSGNFTNLNQLTTRNFSDLQNKPTTLVGYGISASDTLFDSKYSTSGHTHNYLPLDTGRPAADLATLRTSGIKGGGSTTTNRPAGSYDFSPYMVMQSATDRFVQLWFDSYGGNNIYYRNGTNSVWGGWNRLWHSGNLANGTTAQYIRGDGSLATYSDTTYPLMTATEASTGTATTARTISAKVLADEINRRSDLRYLSLSGGSISGNVTVGNGTGQSILRLNNAPLNTNLASRIEFRSTDGQHIQLRANTHDIVRSPYGFHIEKTADNTEQTFKAYLSVEGDIISGGYVTASTFVKSGSSNSYILLGGGGHKAVSDFTPSLVTSTTSSGITNVATTNTNTYLNIVQGGSSAGSSTQVTGTGSVTVSSDASGKLTINGINSYVPLSGASFIQSIGRSTSWGVTNGTSTGAFNAIMGTANSATWLLSGTSGGTFRAGIQALDSSGTMRFYVGGNYMQFDGTNLYLGGNLVWNSNNHPTTLSGYGITDGLFTEQVSVAQTDDTWVKGYASSKNRALVYNTNGVEWGYLFNFRSDVNYGAVLATSYSNNTLKMLSRNAGTWSSWVTFLHSGNFSVTLNGASTTSAKFYAPTTQLSVQSGTNSYLIGASSTTSLGTVYSNAGIYMNGSKLYTGDIQASGSITASGGITASNLWGISSKNVSLTLTTNWQDTGILMNDSTLFSSGSGTYIIELYSDTPGVSSQWSMRYSGVMAVFTTQTNSTDTDEIILHSMGHASNGRHIYLRTVLQTSPNYAKIQIATSASWSGAGTITIKTRRII